jgi:4-amino-4-deoxy-L-arabinose transferase-like glycosyltransferase
VVNNESDRDASVCRKGTVIPVADTSFSPPSAAVDAPAGLVWAGSGWRARVRARVAAMGWTLPALIALLGLTALLYLWGLGRSGWANTYYAAAVQAATKSWKAFFFGSFDSSNFITVDKTPASLWLMALSARVFGLNSWSILVPQALCGVATVGLTYAAVKRWWGAAGGLLAGAVVAATPVAALMFRYNNPDALLTLLLVAAAYSVLRAIEDGRTRWLILAGSLVGFGFLTKMLQAFIVLPIFAFGYLLLGKPRLLKRVGQLAWSALAVLVSAGWWVAVVELWPASSRPFIGGSTTNSILQLTLGYNGLGRLTGNETGAVGPQGVITGNFANSQFGGARGLTRLFASQMGSEISWLLPAALIALAVGAVLAWRKRGSRMLRAGLVIWGGWLLLTAAVFSFMSGIIHPYYNVVLAPAIGALIGMVVVELWRRRERMIWRASLAALVLAAAGWAFVLLGRTPAWLPWLRWALLCGGLVAGVGLLVRNWHDLATWRRSVGVAVATVAVLAALGGSTAYTYATASQPHAGPIPSSGPAGAGGFGAGLPGLGGGGLGAPMPGLGGTMPQPPSGQNGSLPQLGTPPSGLPDGGQGGTGTQGGFGGPGPGGFGQGLGPGGIDGGSSVDSALVDLLKQSGTSYRWPAAMSSASNAAAIQLASGTPILAIGGFNGSDQSLTLAQFQKLVTDKQIHYYIAGGGFANSPNSGVAGQIESWVQQNFIAATVGSATVYDLTAPASTSSH